MFVNQTRRDEEHRSFSDFLLWPTHWQSSLSIVSGLPASPCRTARSAAPRMQKTPVWRIALRKQHIAVGQDEKVSVGVETQRCLGTRGRDGQKKRARQM